MFNPQNFHIYLIEDRKFQPDWIKVGAARNVVQHAIDAWDATPFDTLSFTTLLAISDTDDGNPKDLARGIVSELRDGFEESTDDSELVADRVGSWIKADRDEVESRLRSILEDRAAIVEEVPVQELIAYRDRVLSA